MSKLCITEFLIDIVSFFLIFSISMIFDKWNKKFIVIGALSSICISSLLVILKLSFADSVNYILLLACLFPAAYTDLFQKKILNFNCYLLYALSTFYILYFLFAYHNKTKILILIVTVTICFIFVKFHALGLGDLALLLPVSVLFEFKVIYIIGIACVLSLMLYIYEVIFKKCKDKRVAFAPGLFLGSLITIFMF